MAAEILEVQIKLDTGDVQKGFISLTRDAKTAGDAAGDGLGGGLSKGQAGIVAISEGLNLVKEGIAVVKEIADKAFEFAKAGEEIDAISKRFDILAEQFGVVPEQLKSGIERAVGGTVAMSDALQSASKAFVELGANANQLPAIFELSRKIALQYGGDVTDRVDALSRAIETGATRQLRSVGININAAKVYAEYANSIGVTSSFLNEQQKQQALLNAVLQTGDEKFKNINGSLTPVAENSKKLNVTLKELGETAAQAFNKIFGAGISASITKTVNDLGIFNIKLRETFLGEVPNASQQAKLLADEIDKLSAKQRLLNDFGLSGTAESVGKEIQGLQQKLAIQNQIATAEVQAIKAKNEAEGGGAAGGGDKIARTFEQNEILRKLGVSAATSLSADLKAIFDLRKKDEDTFYASSANVAAQYGEAFKAENIKSEQEIAAIKLQYKDLSVTDQKRVNELIQAKELEHAGRMKDIAKGLAVDIKLASGDFAANSTSDFAKIKTEALALGAAFKSGLVSAIVSGVQSIGTAIVQGKNLLGAFATAMLGVFGNMATQLGTILIGTGIGIESLKSLSGFAAIAAGIGLVAIGSVLSALSGGGNATAPASLPTTSVGGGIASSPGGSSTSIASPAAAAPNVSIVVQGSILDSQDTGHRLITLLTNSFQGTGAQLPPGIVMA